MSKLSVIVARDIGHTPSKLMEHAVLNQTLERSDFEIILCIFSKEETEWLSYYNHMSEKVSMKLIIGDDDSRASLVNKGVDIAEHSVVLFLADDFVPNVDLFRNHLEAHKYAEEDKVVYGPGISPKEQRDASKFLAWLEDSGDLFGVSFTKNQNWDSFFFYLANSSLKKDLVNRIGGFNEALKYNACDDYEFGLRLKKSGVDSVYLPEAVAIHDHPLKEEERYGLLINSGYSIGLMETNLFGLTKQLIKQLLKLSFYFVRHIFSSKKSYMWHFRSRRAHFKGFYYYLLNKESPVK